MLYNLYYEYISAYDRALLDKVEAGKLDPKRYEALWGKLLQWQNYARQVL